MYWTDVVTFPSLPSSSALIQKLEFSQEHTNVHKQLCFVTTLPHYKSDAYLLLTRARSNLYFHLGSCSVRINHVPSNVYKQMLHAVIINEVSLTVEKIKTLCKFLLLNEFEFCLNKFDLFVTHAVIFFRQKSHPYLFLLSPSLTNSNRRSPHPTLTPLYWWLFHS